MHVAEARIHAGLTYDALSHRTGWSEYHLRSLFGGARRPTKEERAALAAAVEQDADKITFGKPPETVKHRKGRFTRNRGAAGGPVQPPAGPPAEANGVQAPGPAAHRLVTATVVKELPGRLVMVSICGVRFLGRYTDDGERVEPIISGHDLT
jgi:hypothetical protein